MLIEFNGKRQLLTDPLPLARLLDNNQAKPPFAVAVNGRFVPKGQYASLYIKEGDRIEVLAPMEGG